MTRALDRRSCLEIWRWGLGPFMLSLPAIVMLNLTDASRGDEAEIEFDLKGPQPAA